MLEQRQAEQDRMIEEQEDRAKKTLQMVQQQSNALDRHNEALEHSAAESKEFHDKFLRQIAAAAAASSGSSTTAPLAAAEGVSLQRELGKINLKVDTLASAMRDMDKKLTGGMQQMLRWMKKQQQESDFEGTGEG